MKPNIRAGSKPAPKPCALCQLVRRFLLAAGFLLVAIWVKPDWRLPPHIDYTALVGDLFLVAFAMVFVWKFWRHRREQAAEARQAPPLSEPGFSRASARAAAQARAQAALAASPPASGAQNTPASMTTEPKEP